MFMRENRLKQRELWFLIELPLFMKGLAINERIIRS